MNTDTKFHQFIENDVMSFFNQKKNELRKEGFESWCRPLPNASIHQIVGYPTLSQNQLNLYYGAVIGLDFEDSKVYCQLEIKRNLNSIQFEYQGVNNDKEKQTEKKVGDKEEDIISYIKELVEEMVNKCREEKNKIYNC